jgi:flagellar biogenesis protein FliO
MVLTACHVFRFHRKASVFFFILTVGTFLGVSGWTTFSWAEVDNNSPIFNQESNQPTSGISGQTLALPDATPNPAPGFFSIFFRFLAALILTIVLIYLTIWGLKFIWEKRGWTAGVDEGKPIKVLSSAYLAPRKTVQLVEVGNRVLVVGVGHEEVNCLDVITDPEEVKALKSATRQGFSEMFQRVVRKQEVSAGESDSQKFFEESRQVVSGYLAKLKKISKKNQKPENKDIDEV